MTLPASEPYSLANRRVFVAGHKGMVGSAVVRRLARENCEILTAGRTRVDLCDQAAVREFFRSEKPDTVILAAAKVGGILANSTKPVDFLYDNLAIELNVIGAAACNEANKLLFLGSSCIYPKFAPQPIPEDALLTGPLEPTNEPYAIAKIAGLKLCSAYRRQYGLDFISVMPTNLYGPGDNFDLETSHVVPALMRKAHEARRAKANEFVIWGTGSPMREFMHVDDVADAMVHVLKNYSDDVHLNIGTGSEVSILETAKTIARIVGFTGNIATDSTKPDGTPRKLLDVSRLFSTGWKPHHTLESGLKDTYDWYLENRT